MARAPSTPRERARSNDDRDDDHDLDNDDDAMTELALPRGFLTLGLTPGCPAGIGPEVLVSALARLDDEGALPPTLRVRFFASPALLQEGARRAGLAVERADDTVAIGRVRVTCAVDDDHDRGARCRPGVVDDDALACQREALLRACVAGARGDIHALVTGPTRKGALVVSGEQFPGQTELVHRHLHDDDGPPLMVFSGAGFVLGLQTVHVPLREVSSFITVDAVTRGVTRLAEAARALLGVAVPHIVVLGVNPHAGEGGLLGRDEVDVVEPAVARLRVGGVDVTGPVAADGFFADVARHRRGVSTMRGVHGVLAMHHDQGLGPYKLLAGGEAVNVTWGLRVPRTSPDHGTADALAGTGRADAGSMIAAITTALRLARR
jgi:4-hydroxythreonine-4-phosphate dehydrogenase